MRVGPIEGGGTPSRELFGEFGGGDGCLAESKVDYVRMGVSMFLLFLSLLLALIESLGRDSEGKGVWSRRFWPDSTGSHQRGFWSVVLVRLHRVEYFCIAILGLLDEQVVLV